MAGGATSALGTLTLQSGVNQGGIWIDNATLAGDADYATGGTEGLLAELRSQHKAPGLAIVGVQHAVGAAGHHLEYDSANDLLIAYVLSATTGDHTQAAAGTDLSGTTFTIVIVSK